MGLGWTIKTVWEYLDGETRRQLARLRRREQEAPPQSWYQHQIIRERLRLTNEGRYGSSLTKER